MNGEVDKESRMPWQRLPTKQSSRKAIYSTVAYCIYSLPHFDIHCTTGIASIIHLNFPFRSSFPRPLRDVRSIGRQHQSLGTFWSWNQVGMLIV